MTLALGDTVDVRMTKWGDRPHWRFASIYLGDDDHGTWLGFPRGTRMTRPGAEYVSPTDQLGLVPPSSWPAAERGWLTTFHGPGGPLSVYVDITAPPTWDGPTVTACDLDLDVVRELDGRVWIDDEDEFAEHQVSLGYPAERHRRRPRLVRPPGRARRRWPPAVRRLGRPVVRRARLTRWSALVTALRRHHLVPHPEQAHGLVRLDLLEQRDRDVAQHARGRWSAPAACGSG